jgi:hypothetical protein
MKEQRTRRNLAITAGVEPNQTLNPWELNYEAFIIDFARHRAISEKFYPEWNLFPNIDYRN